MNHELAQFYAEPSIQKVTRTGRIHWAGHNAIMLDSNPAKVVFAWETVGTRMVRLLHNICREFYATFPITFFGNATIVDKHLHETLSYPPWANKT